MRSRFQSRRARLDQQLAVIAADVEPQEVETGVSVDDARLVLVEDQSCGHQPDGELGLDLLDFVVAVTQHDQVVGVSDQHRGALDRLGGVRAELAIADSSGSFQPVQGHVQQQGTDHPALRGALLGRGELAAFEHSRLQPALDQSPGGEGTELGEKMVVVDPVERRLQVRVQHPRALRVLTLQREVDG